MMVFMLEIFFTASLSLCLAFLFAKLVSMASAMEVEGDGVLVEKKENLDKGVEGVLMEDRKLVNQELEALEKVEYVGGEAINVSQVEEEALEKSSQFCKEKHELVEFNEIVEEKGSNVDHSVKEESEVELKLEEQVEIEDEDRDEDEPISDGNKPIEGASFEIESENIEKEKEKEEEKKVEAGEEETGEVEAGEEGLLVIEDDDWEGIEKSEVEKIFGFASKFVESSENNGIVSKLGDDVKMELYGLHKVAMEGPCREGPPLALMVSARAKWELVRYARNAWQRLGNMTPEVAMEQYVALLSSSVPGWEGGKPEGNYEQDCGEITPGAEEFKVESQESSSLHHQPDFKNERKLEKLQSHGETSDAKSL